MEQPVPDNEERGISAWIFAVFTTASLVSKWQVLLYSLPPMLVVVIVLNIVDMDFADSVWAQLIMYVGGLVPGLAVLHWRFMAGHFDRE